MRILAIICTVITLLLAPFTLAHAATAVPLDSAWIVDPQVHDIQPFAITGGIAFPFPVSPTPDPNAVSPWYGYLVRPWTQPLSGSLSAAFLCKIKSGTPVFNCDSAHDGSGAAPTARLYFQTGGLYNTVDGTRWWSNPLAVRLNDVLGQTVTLTVSLDAAQWSGTFGEPGTANQAGFDAALASPTYIGITFGGEFFGHGVNTTGGKVQFRLFDYEVGQ